MEKRTCNRCDQSKSLDKFRRDGEKYRSVCKDCTNNSRREQSKNKPRAVKKPKNGQTRAQQLEIKRVKSVEYRQRKKAERLKEEEKVAAEFRKQRAEELTRKEQERRLQVARTGAIKNLILNHFSEFNRLFEKEKRMLGVSVESKKWISLNNMDDSPRWADTRPETHEMMTGSR